MTGGTLESLRARNRQAIVAGVQSRPGSSRADIARVTGLSTTTVSALVAQLVDGGVLVEGGALPASGAGGRPATSLGINPAAGAVVGVHLGHGGTYVVVTGLDGTLRAEHTSRSDVDHEPVASLAQVTATVEELLDGVGVPRVRVFGVGVAVSAPVLDSRVMGSPPMLLDWGELDVAALLGARLDLPVYIGNDATLGALAEWRLGAGVGCDDLIYVMLSEGVGAGLVLGGRVHEGTKGTAGELGHVLAVPGGQICRCGNRGCLETVVGVRALMSALAHSRGPRCSLDDLLRLTDDGDAGTRRLVADAGRTIGAALAGICNMLDPGIVVIGGDLAAGPAAGVVLVDNVRGALNHALSPVTNHGVMVTRGNLGARTEATGAALFAASRAAAQIAGAGIA
jgi:predicted NBD/HSP70 family sugar kinase